MKLESICPLTTNSSSELYLFKNTSIEEVEKLLASFNDPRMDASIKEVEERHTAENLFDYDWYDSCTYCQESIKAAFEDPDNKGFVYVHEGNNRMAHWQYWNKDWCNPSELEYENQAQALKDFIEEHLVTQLHLG